MVERGVKKLTAVFSYAIFVVPGSRQAVIGQGPTCSLSCLSAESRL